MRCAICGIRIDSFHDAIKQGRTPGFFGRNQEQELACSSCTETLLQMGEDEGVEVKEEYRGKLRYWMK